MIKYIVTFCLILFSTASNAQYWDEEKRPTTYDTVRSVFLLSDTTLHPENSVKTVKGYVIVIDQWIGEHFEGDAIIPGHMEKKVVKYLLWNRQPVPGSFLIWDVK